VETYNVKIVDIVVSNKQRYCVDKIQEDFADRHSVEGIFIKKNGKIGKRRLKMTRDYHVYIG